MRKSFRSILSLVVLAGWVSCAKYNPNVQKQVAQDTNQSTVFLGQVAGVRMVSRGSSLLAATDGSFEMIYDPNVVHAPNRVDSSDTGTHSSNANCELRLLGKISYFDSKVLARSPKVSTSVSHLLQFSLSDVQVISSGPTAPSTPSELAPNQVCLLYSQELLKKSVLRFAQVTFNKDSLQIPHPYFDIGNATGVSPLFSTERPDSFGLGGGPLQFVRTGLQLDTTDSTLKDIAGNYVSELNTPSSVDLSVNPTLKELVLTHHLCGLKEIFDIQKAYTKAGYLRMQATLVQSAAFTPDGNQESAGPSCDSFKAAMTELGSTGIGLKYMLGLCQDPQNPNGSACTGALLRMGSPSVQEKDSEGYHPDSVFSFKR